MIASTIAMIGLTIAALDPVPVAAVPQGGRTGGTGRTAATDASMPAGPFGQSSLPPTGHATRFKRYATGQQGTPGSAGGSGSIGNRNKPTISPYINLLRSGNLAVNYYNFQRDQQIYNTAAQTQQINTRLRQAEEARPIRQPTRPFSQTINMEPTPLERRVRPEPQVGAAQSNAEEIALLREILRELKAMRESSPARAEPDPAP